MSWNYKLLVNKFWKNQTSCNSKSSKINRMTHSRQWNTKLIVCFFVDQLMKTNVLLRSKIIVIIFQLKVYFYTIENILTLNWVRSLGFRYDSKINFELHVAKWNAIQKRYFRQIDTFQFSMNCIILLQMHTNF